jgi:hypothetical protein
MPFRLEVERLKAVEADLAAARGAAATAREEVAQLRSQAVYGRSRISLPDCGTEFRDTQARILCGF